MSDGDGLLAAILDEPEADVHRLVYADWLDDHDQPRRAAFIRAQVALAPFLAQSDDPFAPTRGIDALHLEPAIRDEFLGPLLDLGGTFRVAEDAPQGERVCQAYEFLFVRGFIEAVTIYGGRAGFRFADMAGDIFAMTPLQHVRVRTYAHREPVVVNFEHDPVTLLTMRRLAGMPGLARLRSLDLRQHYLDAPTLRVLVDSPHLAGLRDLWMDRSYEYPPEGLRAALERRFGPVLHWRVEDDIPF